MNKEWICEMTARALIGDLNNMSNDCIEGLRPRAQYIHFYRNIINKLKDLLQNWCIQDPIRYKIILDSYNYLCSIPKATKDTQKEISLEIQKILNNA